jgi:hypothetical protein
MQRERKAPFVRGIGGVYGIMGNMVNGSSVTNFSRVKDAIKDSSHWFPKYRDNVIAAIVTTCHLVGHLRDQCDGSNPEYSKMLDAIERDCKIYKSRIVKLDDKLILCSVQASKISKSKAGLKIAQTCLDNYLQWFKARRDLHICFKKATADWYKTEQVIFQSLGDNNV